MKKLLFAQCFILLTLALSAQVEAIKENLYQDSNNLLSLVHKYKIHNASPVTFESSVYVEQIDPPSSAPSDD